MGPLKTLLITVLVAYVGVVALMYVFQRALMYFPDTRRTPPAEAGLPQAEEVWLDTADGERVIAWHVPPRGDKPVVAYFHGNGGALNLRADRFRWLTEDGTGLLALSYRGYGGSSGRPTEAGLINDAAALYDYARERYPPARIVLWGESLGTAVAIALAADRPVGGVMLDAPFTSAADVGAAAYRFAPVRWLIKDSFRSDLRIVKVTAPILVLHGALDRVVPIGFGEALFAHANEPKKFVRLPRTDHVLIDDELAQRAVRSFLAARGRN